MVFSNPGFLRSCHGIATPGGSHISLLAVDLADLTEILGADKAAQVQQAIAATQPKPVSTEEPPTP